MIKHELFRTTDRSKWVVPFGSMASVPLRPTMSQRTSENIHQRFIDPHAIDISSIKGRFAWEKIALGDTYIPIIFRGPTKYFCVKMLHKLLPDYPEDVIRRSAGFQYRIPIDLHVATPSEIELLNKINIHHCHWAYSREPFTTTEELVRVSDFLPFYEHLRLFVKQSSIPRTTSTGSVRPILPQTQSSMQSSPDFVVNVSNANRHNSSTSATTTPIQIQPHIPSESCRENIPSILRPIAPTPPALRPLRPPKYDASQVPPRQSSQQSPIQFQQKLPSPLSTQRSTTISSNSIVNSANTALSNKLWAVPVPTPISQESTSTSSLAINSTSSASVLSTSMANSGKQITNVPEKPLVSAAKQSSLSKPTRLHSGWLQINKLYTPYVSTNTSNHHLFKIPISLLTFYDLLKLPAVENNTNELKDSSFLSEQTLVTPNEIELINELCLKQNIKPFSIDTKLITLSTFYQYCSANILFVKELPLNEPKASICKDWASIVQINGGICRLRNTTTLHEQTVPFIGNNLLKTFIISSQCLASATLTTPTSSEIEFLQLILFFSNISINLRNAKLIDIESVQKEYNVDLILLFNDKFPLNVLNYQQQGNRPSTSLEQTNQTNSSVATNTFAESTPPPSPLSPPINNPRINPTAQLPLTPLSSASSLSSTTTPNRFQKTILFHGHSMTAYICSGIGSNSQRECISVRALCNVLYPNSSILDKLETRMIRLLRLKNINRFRPQNHQSIDFTRLVDIKDIEKHWEYIEKGMRSLTNNDREGKTAQEITLSVLDADLKASTTNTVENIDEKSDEPNISIEIIKSVKRPLEGEMENKDPHEEDISILKRIDKHIRLSEENNNEQSKPAETSLIKTVDTKINYSNDDESKDEDEHVNNGDDDKRLIIARRDSTSSIKIVKQKTNNQSKKKIIQRSVARTSNKLSMSLRKPTVPIKKKIRLVRKKPSTRGRSSQPVTAKWVQKYGIEDCYIRLNVYDPIYETGKD